MNFKKPTQVVYTWQSCSRSGEFAVTCEAGARTAELVDVNLIPSAEDFLQPIIASIPVQLFGVSDCRVARP